MSVPISDWGHDHWSTFAYVESCVVDRGGVLELARMRCDPELHPGLASPYHAMFATREYQAKYPTRLRGGIERHEHDDWSCVEDMVAEGVVEWNGTGIHPVLRLTAVGRRVADKLRDHRANGGSWASFAFRAERSP